MKIIFKLQAQDLSTVLIANWPNYLFNEICT